LTIYKNNIFCLMSREWYIEAPNGASPAARRSNKEEGCQPDLSALQQCNSTVAATALATDSTCNSTDRLAMDFNTF
jgi:hypothetical protein